MATAITTAWITKYALTKGIIKEKGEHDKKGDVFVVTIRGKYFSMVKDSFHLTEKAAKAKAEAMRQKKISSLKKQIVKLQAMKF